MNSDSGSWSFDSQYLKDLFTVENISKYSLFQAKNIAR